VFSLALVRGDAGKRRWLVYAHAPLENRAGVNITVPDFGKTTVNVPRAGAFYLIDEADRTTTPVTAAL
jgi:proline racemase